jgi:hypothetical protein
MRCVWCVPPRVRARARVVSSGLGRDSGVDCAQLDARSYILLVITRRPRCRSGVPTAVGLSRVLTTETHGSHGRRGALPLHVPLLRAPATVRCRAAAARCPRCRAYFCFCSIPIADRIGIRGTAARLERRAPTRRPVSVPGVRADRRLHAPRTGPPSRAPRPANPPPPRARFVHSPPLIRSVSGSASRWPSHARTSPRSDLLVVTWTSW